MSHFSVFALGSALLFFKVHSIPLETRDLPATGFTVNQIQNPQFVANGTKHSRATYTRYQSISNNITNVSSTPPDEVVATPAVSDSEYVIPITIDGQQMAVNLDSGSADLWVWSTSLPADEQAGHTDFDPTKTTNRNFSNLQGYKWGISYGDQSSASGTVGIGEVNIGGAVVLNQAVELATMLSETLASDSYINGIVGFGWSDINTVTPQQQNTWFDNVKSTLPLPIFTADLKHSAPGSYDFGFIDKTKYTGSISYHDVDTSYGYWLIECDGYAVGNGKAVLPDDGLNPAIVDTGTSLLMMEEDLVEDYYSQVPKSGYSDSQEGYLVPCSATLPDLTLQFGNYSAVVSGKYLTYGQVSRTLCFGALQEGPEGLNILGDIFMKSQFVVFDGGSDPRVGFAPKS